MKIRAAIVALAMVLGLLPPVIDRGLNGAEPVAKVYVILWFDTEDYILPASDDAALRLADWLTTEGIRAKASRFGEIVSPPVMLQAWTMPAPKLEGIAERGGVPVEMGKNPAAFIEEAGFTGIVATNSEFEIERYPRLGDVISVTQVFEDISDEKTTALGVGHFITWLATYTDQHGEVLGRQRFRVFRFKPGDK